MFLSRNAARFLTPLYTHCPKFEQSREIKRWVAPVLREVNKRKKKMGPEPIRPRSSIIDWNYNAELFAFNKRLKEDMDLSKLQQAFMHQSFIIQEEQRQRDLGLEDPDLGLNDNRDFIGKGEALIESYTEAFLKFSLPKMPARLLAGIQRNLISDSALAYLASNLGMGDLILSADFPAQDGTLADTFKAVVGSLVSSSGEERAYTFIRDFVCTQLNQKDLAEWCEIDNPMEQLKGVCQQMKIGEPEPRLIGEAARNTVLSAYHVGIYSDRNLIGSGFGESVQIAVDIAAYNTLRVFWGFPENMKPFNFNVEIQNVAKENVRRVSS